ncbi:uncharacterized protein KY384_005219 [Bacidia gigantensis]|uniref:uncharacterized protein n=1 Tax=Bacidia gigantensis TaxID=2732470 RepID=UPI001D044C76|nr:uncharacterized protein KY384_005219 [Bacidia gigantensis]KAG8529738.1 hypothetical protein KY384_005219 [Bacidia gigantensis]
MSTTVLRPRPNPSKTGRPNYNQIHRYPLPLETFPLPPLIPHNPLSLVQIAFVYLSQLLSPPSSHRSNFVQGIFCPDSNSVHVTDHAQARLLWERGFFGKGSLSRSEPTWLDRENKRLGLAEKDTSEEYRQQRRQERQTMKMERARQQQEAIDAKRAEEGQGGLETNHTPLSLGIVQGVNGQDASEEQSNIIGVASRQPSLLEHIAEQPEEVPAQYLSQSQDQPQTSFAALPIAEDIEVQEHLQLSAEEAFFLIYALGVLTIYDPITQTPMPTEDLFTSFRSHSHFPPTSPNDLTPYDPFLQSYTVYHHFRSLGWVVRQGIKFGVDWLLYLRGPPFHHAEFAVVVLPAFKDDYWWENGRKEQTVKREKKDWWWLHCVQRVQAQVKKGLVVCYVEIPRPIDDCVSSLSVREDMPAKAKGIETSGTIDIGKTLEKYKVREFVIKRWIPNRSRD